MTPNMKAFLDTVAISEGTYHKGDNGYNVICGGTTFSPYDEHPNVKVDLGHGLISTAAGRYQFLHKTWVALADVLDLYDFSPASQDAGCMELIKERAATDDVEAGRFDDAITKCAKIWASLPGAGYGQHENRLSMLRGAFVDAGGVLAA